MLGVFNGQLILGSFGWFLLSFWVTYFKHCDDFEIIIGMYQKFRLYDCERFLSLNTKKWMGMKCERLASYPSILRSWMIVLVNFTDLIFRNMCIQLCC